MAKEKKHNQEENKTKNQLRDELQHLRRRVTELETSIAKYAQAEESFRKSGEAFKDIIEITPVGFTISTPEGEVININSAMLKHAGYDSREELVNTKAAMHWVDPKERDEFVELAKKGTVQNYEARFKKKDGTIFWGSLSSLCHATADGEVRLITAVFDITERKNAEEALKESEEKYKSIVENSYDLIMLTGPDGKITYLSPACREVLGYDPEELVGTQPWMIHQDDLERVQEVHHKALQGENGSELEYRVKTKEGKIKWITHSWSPMMSDGQLKMIVSVVKDITNQKQAELELRKERDRAQKYLEVAGVMFVAIDSDQKITLINKKGCEILGYEENEIIGKNWFDTFIPENKRHELKIVFNDLMLGKGKPLEYFENEVVTRSSEKKLIAWHNTILKNDEEEIIGTLSSGIDITEKRKLQEELLRTSKLESVGMLAGGIANDFNNILTAILGNISLGQKTLHPEDETFDILKRAEKATMRAKNLTRQLLTFSKGGEPVRKIMSITDLIREATTFSLQGSNVRCKFSIPSDLWPVEADKSQITQVVNNLVINAKQAMWEGGLITLRAENVVVYPNEGFPLKPGKYVKTSVEDHGIGISKENLKKIFDPYFTTRQEGSGLGLATAFSIVKNHDGCIMVESELGTGTTFDVYLPASEEELPHKTTTEEKQATLKGRVLVMDDEKMIREVAGEMLELIGYETDFAEDGKIAIDMYKRAKESKRPFDAVIVDLTVPGGMGGKEAVKKLIEIDPEVAAIVSSGYSNDPIMSDFKHYGFKGVVVKPYRISDLREALDKVLSG